MSPKNPKVLHIIDSGGLYGAEMMLLHLMEAQLELGLDPILASIALPAEKEKPIVVEAQRRGLRAESFPMRPGPNWMGAFSILRFARVQRVDLLHTHGYKGNILFALLPGRMRRLPLVATVHGWTSTGGLNRMRVYEWLDGWSLRLADRVVLVSEAMKNHSRVRKLQAERVVMVPNGIPHPPRLPDPASLRADVVDFVKQGFSIAAVGRLSPEKGFDVLIEAVSRLVRKGLDLYLAIFGQGVLRIGLERQARNLGISERILFAGYVENARDHLGLFNLFCMPSRTEGLPLVLLEAMSSRVPVVASRIGGIPEVLEQGRLGYLITPGSIGELESAIAEVFAQPAACRDHASEAAARVSESYSSQEMGQRYLQVYRDVLSNMVSLKSSHPGPTS